MTSPELLTGHTTVKASAGSGKTYLLISRIVRLLLTGAKAGNILAITFTRKAANEMQTRLLERLFELATCDENKLKQILTELQLQGSPELMTRCRGLYEQILRTDAPVKTSTFHAFCQELLRRFPMEADVAPGFDLLDKTTLLYNEAWDALMANAQKNSESKLAESLQMLFNELGLYNTKQALTNFLE
ncbi:MAG: UvrD-helicase domain-containing protein, partial [Gammaproteobacteria bacterium]|nr:UvrD-helicase domain-containing protein [Gammaproteobacteria bacterium]